MARRDSTTIRHPARPLRRVTLPVAPIAQHHLNSRWPPLWWVGCHGGAGTTTLAAVTGLGVDGGTTWPAAAPGQPAVRVVLVCRANATGVQAATSVVEQWRRQSPLADIRLLGVVAVAASARKPPRRVAERLRLLAGWVPRMWRVGWVEEYLAADDPRDLGIPPDVAALRHGLGPGRQLSSEVA